MNLRHLLRTKRTQLGQQSFLFENTSKISVAIGETFLWAINMIYMKMVIQVGQQFRTTTGPIDILGMNKTNGFLVFELNDRHPDVVVGQTPRYMGWVKEHLCSASKK